MNGLIFRFDLLLFLFLNVIKHKCVEYKSVIFKAFPKSNRITGTQVQTTKSATCWLKTELHIVLTASKREQLE